MSLTPLVNLIPQSMNPHDWRKFEQAQRNMLRHLRGRSRRRYFYWIRQFSRHLVKVDRWLFAPRPGP